MTKVEKILNLPEDTFGTHSFSTKGACDIEGKNVGFKYSNQDKMLFENLNFRIPQNAIYNITGGSSSGKTALLNILAGFIRPSKGKIILNGADIQSYDIDAYRNTIGFYLQDIELFQGTLADNIKLGSTETDIDAILSLCREIGITNFADLFPDGLYTQITNKGLNITPKSRKLILLLRCLIGDKNILILDEPFRDTDPALSEGLKNYLMKRSRTATIILSSAEETLTGMMYQNFNISKNTL